MADRSSRTMTGVVRSFTVPASPRDVRAHFEAELARRDFDLSVAQRGALNDEHSGRDLADLHFLRAQHSSVFAAWRTSWSGAWRRTPQVLATLAGRAGDELTQVQLNAGLYRSESPEAQAAEAVLDELAAARARE